MFTAPEEVVGYIHDKLDQAKGQIGLGYVAYGDEELLPRYPAVKVTGGPLTKEIHRSRGYLNTFTCDVWVYHAKLTVSRSTRTKEDLELVTAIRKLMHKDMTLGGNVIDGWFVSEFPGAINRLKGDAVVGTRMVWSGRAVEVF